MYLPAFVIVAVVFNITILVSFPNTESLFLTNRSTKPKMAETVISVVVDKLIPVATEQISLVWGFKELLTDLQDSLTTIQAVLADAERRQVGEKPVRLWMRRLKNAMLMMCWTSLLMRFSDER